MVNVIHKLWFSIVTFKMEKGLSCHVHDVISTLELSELISLTLLLSNPKEIMN